MEIDTIAATELALYTLNDADIYRSRRAQIEANLARKIKAGTYDAARAMNCALALATLGGARYAKEFGQPSDARAWFPLAVRREAAVDILRHIEDAARDLAAA